MQKQLLFNNVVFKRYLVEAFKENMKKLNCVVYHKLLLQAEEAKDRHLTKLADGILQALTANPETEPVKYSSGELNEDVYKGLWAVATAVLKYHDVESVDAEKLNETLEVLAGRFISEVEETLGVEGVGPLEPKVPGQKD